MNNPEHRILFRKWVDTDPCAAQEFYEVSRDIIFALIEEVARLEDRPQPTIRHYYPGCPKYTDPYGFDPCTCHRDSYATWKLM